MQSFTEHQAENFLEKNKFNVAKRTTAKNIYQLKKTKIPFPWVMKISSEKIMHKAKLGGVKVNIKSLEEAEKTLKEFSKIKFFQEVIIQEMIRGKEIVIGIKKTPEFGHALMFGKGGTSVEKEKDIAFRIYPLKEKDISELTKDTKISQTLDEKEIKQIIVFIKKIQFLIKKYPDISELDINPLFIDDKTSTIADARIVFE